MQNSSILKNELIFQYAAGTASLAKSLMASTYLFLNSRESSLYNQFENYCGEELKNITQIELKNLTAEKCIVSDKVKETDNLEINNPLNNFVGSFNDLSWKKIYSGFYEYIVNLSIKENAKLIKMTPGTKVPLHTHNGKEYILVLEGSFCDEYGTYSKGDLQINDSKIKHTPIACKNEGCICLTITEEELVFFGPFAPIFNLIEFIKSLIKTSK